MDMPDNQPQDRRWHAAFILRTNLRVVPKEATLTSAFGADEVHFSNVDYNGDGVYFLDLKIVFRAGDIEDAHSVADETAETVAYALSFVSGAGVRVDHPVYLIDWEPGLKTRDQYTYAKHAVNDPLDALNDDMLRTLAAVSAKEVNSPTKAAMRWYGRAARATVLEDRYLYYFFAIEVLAAAEQFADKVVPKCPRCKQDLICANPDCGHPEHRPFPAEKIGLLLQALGMHEKLAHAAVQLRHKISHGTERDQIVAEMKELTPDFELEQAVAHIGNYATKGLHRAFDFREDQPLLTFYFLETPENINISGRAHIQVGLKGDPDNPRFEDVWMPELSLIFKDPKTGKEEVFHAGGTPVDRPKPFRPPKTGGTDDDREA